MHHRKPLLLSLFQAAVRAADPAACVAPALPERPRGRTIVIGAGKASAAMAQAVERAWDGSLEGLVVTRYGHAAPCERIRIVEAAHPVPDAAGLAAAQGILNLVSNLTADLASDLQDSGLKPLADLGYRAVDLTWTMAAAWREEARELAIDEFALTGRDMGRMAVKARAGNIGSDVFSPDTAVALVALLGASAQGLEVTLQNGGLYERLLAKEARAKRKSPDALRAEYAATATLSIPMALGGSPQARQLGETVGRFLARPGTLRIVTTPKDPAGLGITELMSVDNPLALLQRVDIRATLD